MRVVNVRTFSIKHVRWLLEYILVDSSIDNVIDKIFDTMRYCDFCRMMTDTVFSPWEKQYDISTSVDRAHHCYQQSFSDIVCVECNYCHRRTPAIPAKPFVIYATPV